MSRTLIKLQFKKSKEAKVTNVSIQPIGKDLLFHNMIFTYTSSNI